MASAGAVRAGRAYVELFTRDAALVRGLRQAEARVRSFGNYVANVGKQMLIFGGLATAPIVASVRVFQRFDDTMRFVKATTQATAKEFVMLTDKARLLGRTTSWTSEQVAEAMAQLGLAGVKSDGIDAMVSKMLDLARATRTELGAATTYALRAVNAFDLGANNAERAVDVLAATALNSAQTLDDVGNAMEYVAANAAVWGDSIEDVALNFAIMAKNGITASKAGTALRRIYSDFSKSAVQAKLAQRGINIVADEATGRLRPVLDILQDYHKALKDNPNDEYLRSFTELTGLWAQAGSISLARGAYSDLEKAIFDSAGTARNAAAEMDAGIGGAMRLLWSAVNDCAIAVGDALAPALISIAKIFRTMGEAMSVWIGANKEAAVTVALIAAAVIGAGIAFTGLGFACIGIANGLQFMAGALATAILPFRLIVAMAVRVGAAFAVMSARVIAAVSAKVAAVVAYFGAMASAVIAKVAIMAAVVAAKFAVMFLPVTLAIGAVVLAFRNWDTIKGIVSSVFGSVSSVIGSAMDWIGKKFSELWGYYSESFGAIVAAIKRGDIESAMAVMWAEIEVLWENGIEFLTGLWDGFLDAFNVVCESLANVWNNTLGVLFGQWKTFQASINEEGLGVATEAEKNRFAHKRDPELDKAATEAAKAFSDARTEFDVAADTGKSQEEIDVLRDKMLELENAMREAGEANVNFEVSGIIKEAKDKEANSLINRTNARRDAAIGKGLDATKAEDAKLASLQAKLKAAQDAGDTTSALKLQKEVEELEEKVRLREEYNKLVKAEGEAKAKVGDLQKRFDAEKDEKIKATLDIELLFAKKDLVEAGKATANARADYDSGKATDRRPTSERAVERKDKATTGLAEADKEVARLVAALKDPSLPNEVEKRVIEEIDAAKGKQAAARLELETATNAVDLWGKAAEQEKVVIALQEKLHQLKVADADESLVDAATKARDNAAAKLSDLRSQALTGRSRVGTPADTQRKELSTMARGTFSAQAARIMSAGTTWTRSEKSLDSIDDKMDRLIEAAKGGDEAVGDDQAKAERVEAVEKQLAVLEEQKKIASEDLIIQRDLLTAQRDSIRTTERFIDRMTFSA